MNTLNVIQSLDAWLVRQVHLDCSEAGVPLMTIHDSFQTTPSNMEFVRNSYKHHLAALADMDYMSILVAQFGGENQVNYQPGLSVHIKSSRYALT